MKKPINTSLLVNSRFYVLSFSFLLSVATFAYLRLSIHDNQLLAIRTQQFFGFFAVVYWYVALIISPLGHIIGKEKLSALAFMRRAIGVSAFYFALLHAIVALFGQLGGFDRITYLPEIFKWALLFGAVALGILGLMAATSFDKVVAFMTYRKWKWLHRLVYFAGLLVILHVWMVGTHLAYDWVRWTAFIAVVVLLGLELFGVTGILNKKLKLSNSEMWALFLTIWAVAIGILLAFPALVQNYHSRHTEHGTITRGLQE